jgi:hypothetical protein
MQPVRQQTELRINTAGIAEHPDTFAFHGFQQRLDLRFDAGRCGGRSETCRTSHKREAKENDSASDHRMSVHKARRQDEVLLENCNQFASPGRRPTLVV